MLAWLIIRRKSITRSNASPAHAKVKSTKADQICAWMVVNHDIFYFPISIHIMHTAGFQRSLALRLWWALLGILITGFEIVSRECPC